MILVHYVWVVSSRTMAVCFLQTPFKFPMHSYLKYLALLFSPKEGEMGTLHIEKEPYLLGLTRFKSKRQRQRKQRKVLLWRPRKQMLIGAQTHRSLSQRTCLSEQASIRPHSQIKFRRLKGCALKNILYCWNTNLNFVTETEGQKRTPDITHCLIYILRHNLFLKKKSTQNQHLRFVTNSKIRVKWLLASKILFFSLL